MVRQGPSGLEVPQDDASAGGPSANRLRALLQPAFQPASIILQKERAATKTLAKNAMRLGIARCACNPLLPYLVLAGREPFLRQDFDQPGVGIEKVQRERWS